MKNKTPIFWEEVEEIKDDIKGLIILIIILFLFFILGYIVCCEINNPEKIREEALREVKIKKVLIGETFVDIPKYYNFSFYSACSEENVSKKTGDTSTSTYKFCIE
jgi:hypothetical protein